MKDLGDAKKLELEIWNHLPYMIRSFGITGGTTTVQSLQTYNKNKNHTNIFPNILIVLPQGYIHDTTAKASKWNIRYLNLHYVTQDQPYIWIQELTQ